MRSSDEEIDIIRKTLDYSATGSTHLEPGLLKNLYRTTRTLPGCNKSRTRCFGIFRSLWAMGHRWRSLANSLRTTKPACRYW